MISPKQTKYKFNYPDGTHDDRFWSLALAVTPAQQTKTATIIRAK